MKLVFDKAGKYKSGVSVVNVSESDVKAEKVFDIADSNAIAFIKAESAHDGEPKKEDDENVELEKMTVEQLKKFAEDNEIDLGEAKKKAEILDVIEAVGDSGDGE